MAAARRGKCHRQARLRLQLTVAALALAAGVGASEVPEVTQRSTTIAPLARAPLREYNAPDPAPALSNHLRAVVSLGLLNWTIWQISWLRNEDWPLVTRDSLGRNLHQGFAFDQDELQTNFFGHPYHGGLSFNAARAAGLGFWTSTSYTFASSLGWELFAETEPPSFNDLLVTSLAGVLLGEITYRLSSELLDDGSSGGFRLLRELGAAAVSPVRGFNRAYTGQALRHGPSPIRHPVDAALVIGAERMRARAEDKSQRYQPTLLLAADVSYGDLLDRGSRSLTPMEFFELYAGVNLFQSEFAGAQIYSTSLLYGWSHPFERRGRYRGNHVLGLAMTYEFQGSNLATYGGVGLGPAYYLACRSRRWRLLQLGVGLDLVPIVGVTVSPPLDGTRPYDFGMGVSSWTTLRWDLDRFGEFRFRSRHYATRALDGVQAIDYVGSTRLSYEVSAIRGVGLGVAPMLIYQRRLRGQPGSSILQSQAQLYLRLRL
jgi:hypothetical protein